MKSQQRIACGFTRSMRRVVIAGMKRTPRLVNGLKCAPIDREAADLSLVGSRARQVKVSCCLWRGDRRCRVAAVRPSVRLCWRRQRPSVVKAVLP